MEHEWLPLVLQTSDPLFPTGAYAHSLGLEEIVRMKVVTDEKSLSVYLRSQIRPLLERLELPYLRFLREAALGQDLDLLERMDGELSAIKVAEETRAASRQIGRRRLMMLREILPSAFLEEVTKRVSIGTMEGHHLTIFAVQMIQTPLSAALAVWTYQTFAGACSASLKLLRIGQEGCQRVLSEALADLPDIIGRSLEVVKEDAGWFSPLLDLAGMRHATSHERLFIS